MQKRNTTGLWTTHRNLKVFSPSLRSQATTHQEKLPALKFKFWILDRSTACGAPESKNTYTILSVKSGNVFSITTLSY